MLKEIKIEIDRRWPTNATKASGDGRFFEEVHATLAAMQNPYRNSTMHLDQIYTEEDAKDLFGIVRGVMRKVSLRCDENGEPKV